jgi:hypothetical protein
LEDQEAHCWLHSVNSILFNNSLSHQKRHQPGGSELCSPIFKTNLV